MDEKKGKIVNKFTNILRNFGKKQEVVIPTVVEKERVQTYAHGHHHHHDHNDPNSGDINGSSSICVGATTTYTTNGDKNGIWSSSDTTIVTINSKGIATGISKGNASIKYSVTKGNRTEYTIKSIVIHSTLNPGIIEGDSSLCVGSIVVYTSTGEDGGKWSSSDSTIATINYITGSLRGVSEGTIIIKYSITNMCGTASSTKKIVVNPVLTAGKITGELSICVGSTTQYTSNGNEGGVWSSDNILVANVNEIGLVSGISKGTSVITYSVSNMCGTDSVAQKILIVSILKAGVISGEDSICVGTRTQFTSNGDDEGNWTSDNYLVANVTSSGEVIALSEGVAVITYTVKNMCGFDSTTKSISIIEPIKIGQIIGTTPVIIGETTQFSIENTDGAWSSSNTAIATVDSNGQVSGISKGIAVISYTVSNICGTATSKKAVTVVFKDRVLFILKNNSYPEYAHSFGLYNSSKMIMDFLIDTGNVCEIASVDDSTGIESVVYNFKPTFVVIEALWLDSVTLKTLMNNPDFKNIKWVIRIHSNIGFLAAEPLAFKYIHDYINLNSKKVIISCNNDEFAQELTKICDYHFKCLPDIFSFDVEEDLEATVKRLTIKDEVVNNSSSEIINIGSFGALRVLKNQLFQAMCAILTADKLNKTLHFHINGDVDDVHNPVLLNMIELFNINNKHKLVCHDWLNNADFYELIKSMDMGLQLSYTESFNIVTADFVYNEVPILVSESIDWMPELSIVSDVDYDQVVFRMRQIYTTKSKLLVKLNKLALLKYNTKAKLIWDKFIR